jgi:hypothetical protein
MEIRYTAAVRSDTGVTNHKLSKADLKVCRPV